VLRQALLRVLEGELVDICQDKPGFSLGKKSGGVKADTAARARNQDDFVSEWLHKLNICEGEQGVNKK
jgi:hypothetical protein